MSHDGWPSSDDVRELIAQLDERIRESELIRGWAEASLRRRQVYPERRNPKHWQRLPDECSDSAEG